MKKVVSFILAFFLLVTPLSGVFAVQYNGSNNFYMPGIQGRGNISISGNNFNIDGINFWNFSHGVDASFSDIQCVKMLQNGKCNTYLAQITYFVELDLGQIFEGSYYDSFSSGQLFQIVETQYNQYISPIRSKMYIGMDGENLEIYRVFAQINHHPEKGDENLQKFARFKKQNCGKFNVNKCVFHFTDNFYYVADEILNGIYLAYSDLGLFNNEQNNHSASRKFYDERLSEIPTDGFFNGLFRYLSGYNGGYGMRISPLQDKNIIYYRRIERDGSSFQENEDEYIFVKDGYFEKGKGFIAETGYYQRYWNTPLTIFYNDFVRGGTYSLRDIDYPENYPLQIILSDFFFGQSGNKHTNFNLKQHFQYENLSHHGISGTGATGNPQNWDSDEQQGGLISGIVNGIKGVFGGLLDILKNFFQWAVDFLKSLIWTPIYEAFEPIISFFISLFSKIKDGEIINREFLSKQITLNCEVNYNYSITDDERQNILNIHSGSAHFFNNNFLNGIFSTFRFINPVIPLENSQICTYSGMKEVTYRNNSWIDILFVMLFGFLTLLLFYRRT